MIHDYAMTLFTSKYKKQEINSCVFLSPCIQLSLITKSNSMPLGYNYIIIGGKNGRQISFSQNTDKFRRKQIELLYQRDESRKIENTYDYIYHKSTYIKFYLFRNICTNSINKSQFDFESLIRLKVIAQAYPKAFY